MRKSDPHKDEIDVLSWDSTKTRNDDGSYLFEAKIVDADANTLLDVDLHLSAGEPPGLAAALLVPAVQKVRQSTKKSSDDVDVDAHFELETDSDAGIVLIYFIQATAASGDMETLEGSVGFAADAKFQEIRETFQDLLLSPFEDADVVL